MRTTEQSKRSETEQGSLFAQEYLMKQDAHSELMHRLSGVSSLMVGRLELAAKESNSLSRSSDPETSKVAGEKTKEFRARHIAKIWACLKESGSKTYKEIAALTGLEPVAVARRRKEMEENHLIEVLGEARNGCALWRAKC